MEFAFETHYDHHALKAMARALRKTVRGKRSRRSGVWGAAVMVLGILLIITADDFGVRQIITAAAVISILLASLFQDGINAYFARKRGLPGTEHVITEFSENSYHSKTAIGSTEFHYGNIQAVAEDAYYFVFIFSSSHAQLFDKRTIRGGTTSDFAQFISGKTGKQCITIS